MYLKDRVHRTFHGLDVGFHSKVFGLRTWEDGSGIDQDREEKAKGRPSWKGTFRSSVWGMLTLRCPLDIGVKLSRRLNIQAWSSGILEGILR